MIKLSDIDDPFFEKEAEGYAALHGQPHPLLPYKRFVDEMVRHGVQVDLNEFDFVTRQAVRVRLGECYLDVTRCAIEHPDGAVRTAHMVVKRLQHMARTPGVRQRVGGEACGE